MQRTSRDYLVSCKDSDFESQLADVLYLVPLESEEKKEGESFLKLDLCMGMAVTQLGQAVSFWRDPALTISWPTAIAAS